MQENLLFDDIDSRIITALRKDSRRSYSDVGTEVGLSTAAVHERVKKLLEKGVIEHFSLKTAPE
jgi:Lrp/AsnC family transcriptional regulator, leucine-responsive regulatory protein